jgi:RNA polymerase sigma-70 factor (ECF subfamily)
MTDAARTIALSTEEYQRILDLFQGPLVRFVRSLVGSGEEVYDIVQDVFVDAWRALQREARPFVADGNERDIRKWLYHAAYCHAVSMLRHRSVVAWESLDIFESADLAEGHAPAPFEEQVTEREALRAALATLEPADVACLQLRVVEDLTSVEIARILEITPDAARKRLSRAMHRLRAAYFARDHDAGNNADDQANTRAKGQERTRP